MTKEEILALKAEIHSHITELTQSFVGRSMNEFTELTVKNCINDVLKKLLFCGYDSILALIEFDVNFSGNAINATIRPKRGLDNYEHCTAVRFIFNEDF